MLLLGLLIRGAIVAAALSAIVVVVNGIITKDVAKQQLRNRGVTNAMVDKINNCTNCVSIKDLDSDNTYEIRGEGIGYDISEGDVIYC